MTAASDGFEIKEPKSLRKEIKKMAKGNRTWNWSADLRGPWQRGRGRQKLGEGSPEAVEEAIIARVPIISRTIPHSDLKKINKKSQFLGLGWI